MIKLLKYMRWYYWVFMLLIIGFVYAQVTLDLYLPQYMNQIIVKINEAYYGIATDTFAIWDIGLRMLIIVAFSVICSIVVGYFASIVAAGFSRDVRGKVFNKVEDFSLQEIEKFSTASLITRTTNDIRQIQMTVVMFLRMAISAPLMAFKAISLAIEKSSSMSALLAIAVSFLVIVIVAIFIVVIPKFSVMQKLTDRLNLVTRENLTGLRVVRASNAENIEIARFADVNEKITKTNIFVNRVTQLMMPTIMLTMNGMSLAIIWVGAILINQNTLNIGDVIEFQQYGIQVVFAFMMITMLGIFLPRGFVSAKRVREVLKTPIQVVDPKQPTTTLLETGTVEFKDVSFFYPGAAEAVIENINFKVKQGETVAFIGSTGSGKSTIINLIPRFYDATRGEVLINGINVKELTQEALRSKIGYIPQNGVLFSGTIESNLRLGKSDATDFEMNQSLELAQATDFVSKLELGLQAPISQGGSNVSGGQKQRLSIARAIIKKPEIFIFDDSFSALDFKTERALRENLEKETAGSTKLIIAQRIGTIMNADQIIVLDQGKIVGMGKHKTLLETSDVYREIALSQLSEEELVYA